MALSITTLSCSAFTMGLHYETFTVAIRISWCGWNYDIQFNDIQYNDTQHNDTLLLVL